MHQPILHCSLIIPPLSVPVSNLVPKSPVVLNQKNYKYILTNRALIKHLTVLSTLQKPYTKETTTKYKVNFQKKKPSSFLKKKRTVKKKKVSNRVPNVTRLKGLDIFKSLKFKPQNFNYYKIIK
jgi:hypothetical protein